MTLPLVKRIYEYHYNLHYSFVTIGRLLHCAPATAHWALRRYEDFEGDYFDLRKFNGTKNRFKKIKPKIS